MEDEIKGPQLLVASDKSQFESASTTLVKQRCPRHSRREPSPPLMASCPRHSHVSHMHDTILYLDSSLLDITYCHVNVRVAHGGPPKACRAASQ